MGIVPSFLAQLFPGEPKWTVDDIPDLSGTVAIVTGANTGIGKETAKALLSHNAKVYVAARSQERAESAIKDLHQQTGKEAIFLQLDLADLQTIKAAAQEFVSKEKELHILFNSAGVMFPPIDRITVNGYDMQFGVNCIGHFYFTKLLLPTLLSTAKSSPPGRVRVVNTSSFASYTNTLDFNTFKDGPPRRKLSLHMLYAQSKFGNVAFANELARRYGDQGIVSTAVNPGNLKTELSRHMSSLERSLIRVVQFPASYGSLTQLWAGTSLEGARLNGKFLVPWARVGNGPKAAEDSKIWEELWTWLEEQVEDI